MRLPKSPTRLEYAPQVGGVTPRALRKWGWFGTVSGSAAGVLGFLGMLYLQGKPMAETRWAVAGGAVLVSLIAGGAAFVAGVILLVIAPPRPR